MNRRHFLSSIALLSAFGARAEEGDLIQSISSRTLWRNRDGLGTTWFHPRACRLPGANRESGAALMTLQPITGSDTFGPVHWTMTEDMGQTWSDPMPIPAFGREPVPGHPGLVRAVCDVVPEFHAPTQTVLAMGHVVFYRGNRFAAGDQLARYPIYSVRHADGSWSPGRRLEWEDPRGAFIYTNNCGQRVTLPGGDVLLAFSFGASSERRSVAGVRCSFDGRLLKVLEVGPELRHDEGRGLLEPSLVRHNDRFFLTLRAEDDHGFVSTSTDGLRWEPKRAWAWDDGEVVAMSSTQQHWLAHSEGLFLIYTRRHASNSNVIRWRSPLFLSQVNPDTLRLIRKSERVVLPLVGDGVGDPDAVALMGNFHVTNAEPNESWVTVGEWMPRREARGDVLLGRVLWNRRNSSARFSP